MSRRDNKTISRHSRPPLERMLRIHQAIQGANFPNASTLARELEVSTKSIHRDIEFMRDRLELPIEFDSRRNGYVYTQEVTSFPSFQVTEGELFSLLVAEKALQQYRGTHFEKPLVSAFKKISASLPDTISFNLNEWDKAISFRTSAKPVFDLDLFNELSQATAKHQQLKLSYRKPGSDKPEPRVIDPYHLANINGEWFLFAYCHLRKDIRTFVPTRVQAIEYTGKTFKPPRKFDLEKRLRDSFGVHSGEGEFDVVLQFSSKVADFIREKQWHPSQKLTELPNGELEMSLKISSLLEIQRWILSWGGDARVISPPELKSRVHTAAENLLRNHSTQE